MWKYCKQPPLPPHHKFMQSILTSCLHTRNIKQNQIKNKTSSLTHRETKDWKGNEYFSFDLGIKRVFKQLKPSLESHAHGQDSPSSWATHTQSMSSPGEQEGRRHLRHYGTAGVGDSIWRSGCWPSEATPKGTTRQGVSPLPHQGKVGRGVSWETLCHLKHNTIQLSQCNKNEVLNTMQLNWENTIVSMCLLQIHL